MNCFRLFFLVAAAVTVDCWDAAQLEVFDVVEEISRNFYEVLNVDQEASSSDIRRAYRQLSKTLHPDKNESPNAETEFRQLVSIYEVLKDPQKRQWYDEVLRNGLPDWKTGLFYYRRLRKLGLLEASLIMSLLLTVGHYFVMWGSYLEKRITMESKTSEQLRKKVRRRQMDDEEASKELREKLNSIPAPSLRNLWPLQILIFIKNFILALPSNIQLVHSKIASWKAASAAAAAAAASQPEPKPDEEKRKKAPKKPRPEPAYATVSYASRKANDEEVSEKAELPVEWSDKELDMLVKGVAKFPGGTLNRWGRIAQYLGTGRDADEVVKKAVELKLNRAARAAAGPNVTPVPLSTESAPSEDDAAVETRRPPNGEWASCSERTKTSKGSQLSSTLSANWTQGQQRALEAALKTVAQDRADRWERIAACVPGKSKDDCFERYRSLVQILQQRRAKKS